MQAIRDLNQGKLPTCAICGTQVEEMAWEPVRGSELWGWRWKISCHGDVEEGFISEADVVRAISINLSEAFAAKKVKAINGKEV
jgi:hypothetical protein